MARSVMAVRVETLPCKPAFYGNAPGQPLDKYIDLGARRFGESVECGRRSRQAGGKLISKEASATRLSQNNGPARRGHRCCTREKPGLAAMVGALLEVGHQVEGGSVTHAKRRRRGGIAKKKKKLY